MSRARALGLLGFLLTGAAAAAVLLRPGAGGSEFQAEFLDVRGLGLRGNEVRVQGARVGSVSKLELTPRGTVLMTATLSDGAPRPRRDAVAAIRPLDVFGDFYVSLSPGEAREALDGPIPPERTSRRPALDEVLRAFGSPVRGGLQALFVELGTGLERRGVDLGRAAIELRPALAATDGLLRELASERVALRSLVGDAERATGALGRRDGDLRRIVDGLEGTLSATARRGQDLDQGVASLPLTLGELETTARHLEGTARAARPIAVLAGRSAPDLASALERAPAFLSETERAARALRPAVRRTRRLVGPLSPVARDLAAALRGLTAVGPDLRRLTDAAADASPDAARGLLVHLPEALSEPGRQPFDPDGDPRRRYLRTANVLSCESFGRPIGPGCLDGVDGAVEAGGPSPPRRRGGAGRPSRAAGAGSERGGRGLEARRRAQRRDRGPRGQEVRRGKAGGPAPAKVSRSTAPAGEDPLLDYLLGP